MTILNETAEIIRLYFIQQRKLSLSEIGSFDLVRTPAVYSPASGSFSAPSYLIEFRSDGSFTSKDLIIYLSKKKNISKPEANALVDDFSREILRRLDGGEAVYWTGIGSLIRKSGTLEFTPETIEMPYEESISVHVNEKADLETSPEELSFSEESLPAGDSPLKKWNPYLSLLLLLSFLLIVFSIYRNGGLQANRIGNVEPAVTPVQFQLIIAE